MKFNNILWQVAGANVDILQGCTTDQKRYANIGAVILMTSGVAFCAGSFAAYYFSCNSETPNGNIPAALAFGVLWSLLIFCIDRALVVTLQKKEKPSKLWWLLPFVSRFLLAALIATMISIPIELFIFKDYIAGSEQGFLSVRDSLYKANYSGNDDILQFKGLKDEAAQERERLLGEKTSVNHAIAAEQNMISSLTIQKNEPWNYSSDYKLKDDAYTKAYNSWVDLGNRLSWPKNNSRMFEAKTKKDKAYTALQDAKRKWQLLKEGEIAIHTKTADSLKNILKGVEQDYSDAGNSFKEANNTYRSLLGKRERDSRQNEETIKNGNSFIRNYTILEWAVSPQNPQNKGKMANEGVFLWLIRLLFLIIEILPTIVKIVTPYGAYDVQYWKLVEKEKNSDLSKKKKKKTKIVISSNPDKDNDTGIEEI